MPQIKIRGIQAEELCKISEELLDNLVEIVSCPRDYFELEVISSVAIRNGKIAQAYPFVEIACFDRGQKIQDEIAKTITSLFKEKLGIENLDLAFVTFKENSYYENGEHF